MGVVQNIFGLVRDINERKENARIEDVMRNGLGSPAAIYEGMYQIDPLKADAYQRQQQDDAAATAAAEAAAIKARQDRFGLALKTLRGLPEGTDYGATIDRYAPLFKELGIGEESVTSLRDAVLANPEFINTFDDEAWKAQIKDRYSTTVATPGAHVLRGGEVIDRVPFAPKTVTTRGGDGSSRTDIFDPNTLRFITDEATGQQIPNPDYVAPSMDVEQLAPFISAQESGGDWTAINSETGALGQRQVMPETGKALAARVGVAWRPDLMRSNSELGQKYQKLIGDAALQDSIEFGGGDPELVFAHYYGGPDKRQWGPKTRKYVEDMLERTGMAPTGSVVPAGGRRTGTSIQMPGKPAKAEKTTRTLSPAEAAEFGYPEGAVVQTDSTGKQTVTYKPPANAAKAGQQDVARATNLIDTMDQLEGFARDLLYSPGLTAATGSIQGRLPALVLGQDAQNFINSLTNLKQNIGLAELMKFKGVSSQGASGFGNLSNAEGARLEAAYGVLERTSDENQIRKSLRTILEVSATVRERTRKQLAQAADGSVAEGTVIKNPKTGARMVMRNGQWEAL